MKIFGKRRVSVFKPGIDQAIFQIIIFGHQTRPGIFHFSILVMQTVIRIQVSIIAERTIR